MVPTEILLRLRPEPDFGLPWEQRLERAIANLRRQCGFSADVVGMHDQPVEDPRNVTTPRSLPCP